MADLTSIPPLRPRAIETRDVVTVLVSAVFLYLACLGVLGSVIGGEKLSGPQRQLLAIVNAAALTLALLIPVYLMIIRYRGYSWQDLGARPCDPAWMRRAALLSIASVPAAFILSALINQMRKPSASDNLVSIIAPPDLSWIAAGTLILYLGLLIPIAEELVFRGVVFGWLRERFPPAIAITTSATVFSLAHISQISTAIIAFAVGHVLAWLYWRTGSILPSIAFHQIFNMSSLFFVYSTAALGPGG